METTGTRLRIITICHALTGLFTAVWGAGLPALDARLDLGPALIGTMLLLVAGCALLTMHITGHARRSGGWMLSIALPTAGIALVLAGSAPTAPVFLFAAALFGLSCGAVNVALSTDAMAVESAMGRPVIARMHGFWTLGAAGGGMLLAAALHTGLDSRLAMSGTAGLLVAAALSLGPRIRAVTPAQTAAAPRAAAPRAAVPGAGTRIGRGHLIALGSVGAAVFLTEGAATDWAGVHATRVLGADPAAGSVVYGVFFAAMTIVRFRGDSLRRRLGPVRTVRITSSVAVAGYALVLTAGVLPSTTAAIVVALAGWALAGAGTALVWPIIIGTLASAGATPRHLAFVTMISYGGGLLGPALIGFLAQATILAQALLLPAALALLVAVAAPSVLRRHRAQDTTPTSPMPTTTTTTGSTP